MNFRKWIESLRTSGKLTEAKKPLSSHLEAAAFIKALEPKPTLLRIEESDIPIAGNICASRSLIAEYLNIQPGEVVSKLLDAIEHPTKPQPTQNAPCFEISEKQVDLNNLPLLFHAEKDGGKYISSAVIIANQSDIGQNVSFHRLMQIGKDELVIRIVPRHLQTFLEKTKGDLPIAICIGNSPNVLLAGACSVELGKDELEIANALEPLQVAKCAEANCYVPAECEFVLVGRITPKMHEEGPFIDLTETYDLVRSQHVVKVDHVYHREKPVYHALVPGGLEHKVLMGTPREPTIYREVSKVCDCADVYITPGGASWLHAIVKIRKKQDDDARKAIEAAFRGHTSLKHVVIVDEDINVTDPMEVEWAFATRFQGDRGLVIKPGETGSSLDPSADPQTRKTTKVGFDVTKPLEVKGKDFSKAKFPEIDWRRFT